MSKLQVIKCGNCGCGTMRAKGEKSQYNDGFVRLVLICKCGVRMTFKIPKPPDPLSSVFMTALVGWNTKGALRG